MLAIRAASVDDAEALASLSCQLLGRPVDAEAVRGWLTRIAGTDPGASLVAVDGAVGVVGFARVLPQHFVTEAPFAELAVLVVDAAARGRGVGNALLAAVEAWAQQAGFASVWVRSNVVRERAHRFYARAGYAEAKQQKVFAKRL